MNQILKYLKRYRWVSLDIQKWKPYGWAGNNGPLSCGQQKKGVGKMKESQWRGAMVFSLEVDGRQGGLLAEQ